MATASKDIFDEIEMQSTSSEGSNTTKDIFDEVVLDSPPDEMARNIKTAIGNKLKVLGKAGASGFMGGYGDLLDLARAQPKNISPLEQERYARESDKLEELSNQEKPPSFYDLLSLSDSDEVFPNYSRLPNTTQVGEFLGEEEPRDRIEAALQRGGHGAGGAAALGAGLPSLLAILGGSATGETLREFGAPEGVAVAGDIITSLLGGRGNVKSAPQRLGKKGEQELVKTLRSKGFTDKEIVPIIQGGSKKKLLGAVAEKGKRGERAFDASKSKIGTIYQDVGEKGKKLKGLSGSKYRKFEESLSKTIEDISGTHTDIIRPELNKLANSEHKAQDLIRFYQDISSRTKNVQGGRKVLNKLKEPIVQGLESIDKDLATDFKLANKLYSKLFSNKKMLTPGKADQFLNKGKALAFAGSLATGNFPAMTKILGAQAVQLLSRELLINPKLQNLTARLSSQLKANKVRAAYKTLEEFKKTIKDEKPEIYESIDFDKLVE